MVTGSRTRLIAQPQCAHFLLLHQQKQPYIQTQNQFLAESSMFSNDPYRFRLVAHRTFPHIMRAFSPRSLMHPPQYARFPTILTPCFTVRRLNAIPPPLSALESLMSVCTAPTAPPAFGLRHCAHLLSLRFFRPVSSVLPVSFLSVLH